MYRVDYSNNNNNNNSDHYYDGNSRDAKNSRHRPVALHEKQQESRAYRRRPFRHATFVVAAAQSASQQSVETYIPIIVARRRSRRRNFLIIFYILKSVPRVYCFVLFENSADCKTVETIFCTCRGIGVFFFNLRSMVFLKIFF